MNISPVMIMGYPNKPNNYRLTSNRNSYSGNKAKNIKQKEK